MVSTCHFPSTCNLTYTHTHTHTYTRKLHDSPFTYLGCTVVRTKGGNCGRCRRMSSCIRRRRYGGWGLFSSERYPLPTACSFGSAVVMTAAWSRRSTSEDDTVGCCSCLHVAIEVNFLLRRFDGFEVSSLSCHTVGRQICYNRPNLKSETRTPPGEYYAWWSQEILSVYQLDHKKNICG